MAQILKWGGTGKTSISKTRFMERSWGWGASFPANWPANAWFVRTDQNVKYQNTGSFTTPTFTARLGLLAHKHTAAGDGSKLDETTILTIDSVDETLIDAIFIFG